MFNIYKIRNSKSHLIDVLAFAKCYSRRCTFHVDIFVRLEEHIVLVWLLGTDPIVVFLNESGDLFQFASAVHCFLESLDFAFDLNTLVAIV
jgi:hypothetical protein